MALVSYGREVPAKGEQLALLVDAVAELPAIDLDPAWCHTC